MGGNCRQYFISSMNTQLSLLSMVYLKIPNQPQSDLESVNNESCYSLYKHILKRTATEVCHFPCYAEERRTLILV